MIYFIVIILIVVLNFLVKNKKRYCYIVGGILVLFAGLRSDVVGPDTSQYSYAFSNAEEYLKDGLSFFFLSGNNESEPGYMVINYVFYKLFDNYNLFKFICSTLAIVPAIVVIYKYAVNKCIALLIFFTLPVYSMMGMSMMRQGCAFGLFLLAFHYIIERKWKQYFLSVLIASFFHTSAIILLPLYYLYSLPYKRVYNIWIIIIICLTFSFSTIIFSFLSHFSRMKYEAGDAGGLGMLLFMLFLLFSTYLIKESYLKQPLIKFQLYLLVFTILCWLIGMNLAAVFRLAAYTEFFICIFIPNLYNLISIKFVKRLMVLFTCIICIMIMKTVVLKPRIDFLPSYYPYYFFWEK